MDEGWQYIFENENGEIAMDVSEDERILRTSGLNSEDPQDAVYPNSELELSKFLLSQDNMALRSEIKSLRQTLNESMKLIDELEDICRSSAAIDVSTCTCAQRNYIRELKLKEDYRLSHEKIRQDLHEKLIIIQLMEVSTKEHLTTIEELRTENQYLKVQLDKAMAFGGPQQDQPMAGADLGPLPQPNVESAEVEEEEEKKQEVQTKSWWRRQAGKISKGMGTFRLQFKCCLGTRKRRVV